MRKKIIIFSLIISLSLTFAALLSTNPVNAQEDANGYRIEEIIKDKFNKDTLDSGWKLEGATLEHSYNALHCISPVTYGSGPYINGARLTNLTRYEFTIYPQTVQSGANISFNIGMQNYSSSMVEPYVDCKVQLWEQNITFVDYQHNLQIPQPVTSESLIVASVNLYSEKTDVAIVIERKGSSLTEVYVEYKRNGSIVYTSVATPFNLINPRYADGYCGFFWDCLEMDMTNFKVYNDGSLTFEDSFETDTITFSSQDASLGNLHVVGLNATNCYYASINSIKMDSQNELIKNSYTLSEQLNVSIPYEIAYTVKINQLNNNSFVGFGFGLNGNDTKIDAKNAIGFLRLDDTTTEVVAVREGVVDRSNNYQMNISRLAIGKYQTYSISLDYNHNAYLDINGITYKFSNIDFLGEIAVGLIDLQATNSSSIELNEFILNTNTYKQNDSCDITNDFNGTIAEVIDEEETLYKTYINTSKYFVGPQVSIYKKKNTKNYTAYFDVAGSYSAFGVRQKYTEFICEFDLTVDDRSNYQYIGLSFGRQSVVDALVQASTSSCAYLFRCDNNGASTAQVVWGSGCSFSNGTSDQPCSLNIFDENNTQYHIMFVAKNRSVSVYFKEIDAPDSDLGILRAYIPNVNIDGYVSVVGTNTSSFEIDNFKIVNLSDECTQESQVTLREQFNSKESVSDKLVIDGFSKVKDGKLELNNSNISTSMQYLYGIIRFTTYSLETTLQVRLSNDKRIIFDAQNNKIKIVENQVETVYDCSSANLKNIKGKRFEITVLGNEIKVGYKGYYDPLDKLSTSLFVHTLSTPLSRDEITFQSAGKTIIDDLYFFALDNSMKCQTFNYEDDPSSETVWEVKPGYDSSKVYVAEGCSGNVLTNSIMIPAIVLMGLLIFVKKNKVKEEN